MKGDKPDHSWEVLCHVSALLVVVPAVRFGSVLGPLVVWLMKRGALPGVDAHGRAALNFQFSMAIYWWAVWALGQLTSRLPGPMALLDWGPWALMWGLHLLNLVCIIAAGLKAGRGEIFKYPIAIRFLGKTL